MKSNDKFIEEFSFLFKRIQKKDGAKLQLLHEAVTCFDKNTDEVKEAMNAAFKSGVDINHFDEEGNTPLMCLLNEAQKSGKKYKNDFIRRVKFLIERGASLGWSEEKCEEESNKIYHFIKQVITSKNEIDEIYRAQQNLEREAKEELSKYIQNDIEKVSIYGSCAKIQLKDDTNDFKISEFLNSNFCKNNGISGFSTLHSNGKSGIHGVVFEGIRHYVVTDGSYEMTLNWPANGINHTIKIRINADGTVKVDQDYLSKYQAGQIDVNANKNVKLGGLFLAEALAKGRWKENEVQNSVSETIRSSSQSFGTGAKETVSATHHTYERVKSQHTMASATIPGAQFASPGGASPIRYENPLSPEGSAFFEGVFREQNGRPESQSSYSVLENRQQPVVQRQSEGQQQSGNHQQSEGYQRSEQKGDDYSPNRSRSVSESDSGYSIPTANGFELEINSQKAQEKREQRQAARTAREENSRDQAYNLQLLFAPTFNSGSDSGSSSSIHTRISEQQVDPQQLKNRLVIDLEHDEKSDQPQLEKFIKEIRDRSQQDNLGLKHTNPIKAGLLEQTQSGVKAVAESEPNVQNSDEAQPNIEVVEGKTKQTNSYYHNRCDRNRIALANELSTMIQQPWVEALSKTNDKRP